MAVSHYEKADFWSQKARKEGYPARSVYKLQEINEKFRLFPLGNQGGGKKKPSNPLKILDLGAAPGSWSLYILRNLGPLCSLAAADLAPLSRQFDRGLFDGENFFFIQGDIAQEEIRTELLARGPFDLILSDAAPATTGSRTVDTLRSLNLAETVLAYGEKALCKGGNLAVKVFQGGDTTDFLKAMRGHFNTVKSFKPKACRPGSFETYFIGMERML